MKKRRTVLTIFKIAIPLLLFTALVAAILAILNLIEDKDNELKSSTEIESSSDADSLSNHQTAADKANYVRVPNVVGLQMEEAEKILKDERFEIEIITISNSSFDIGEVCSQDPSRGSEVVSGSTVKIYVVSESLTIPKVFGRKVEDAKRELIDIGIDESNIRITYSYEVNDAVSKGEVIKTEPEEGETIEKDDVVTLYVAGGMRKIKVKSASASSTLPAEGYGDYKATNAIDGNPATGWTENAPDGGIGESITLYFDEALVSGFRIRNGYQKVNPVDGSALYYENSSVARIGLAFGQSKSNNQSFGLLNGEKESTNFQEIIFDTPVMTDSITFTIEDTYSGSKWQDTTISEIEILSIEE